MKNKFKIGGKALCINKNGWLCDGRPDLDENGPKYNEVLIVSGISESELFLKFDNHQYSGDPEGDWFPSRLFIPIEEDFAEEVLKKISEQIKEENKIHEYQEP